ncbi:Uncharacterized protein conserved in bacteria [uncultured Roseburia sp.]|nr:Uncharacterized protein conserved in bacteria [uncultured Roseburia sp.]
MLQKIAKIITNNFGLKCLAVVVAVVFWLVIVNVEDPERTRVFTVPVTIENESYLTDMGKTYEVLNHSDTITFTVTAKRSVIERVTNSDFTATANMRDIVNMSEIPVTITAQKYANQLTITKKSQYVEINVENIVSRTFDIQTSADGAMTDGYSVGDLTVSPEQVKVTGPESVVNSISTAEAHIDISSVKTDAVENTDIVLYDEKGKAVSQDRLTMDHKTVQISVGVLQKKTVPVKYESNGTPAEGCRVTGISGSIEKIIVQGAPEAVEGLDTILISGDVLNVSGQKDDLVKIINLSDYLPEGVSLAADQNAETEVTVSIEGVKTSTYKVPAGNITLQNVPEGFSATLKTDTVPVEIEGYASELKDISEADLVGTADLSGLKSGTHEITVKMSGNYKIVGTVKVTVELKEDDAADNKPPETNQPDEDVSE